MQTVPILLITRFYSMKESDLASAQIQIQKKKKLGFSIYYCRIIPIIIYLFICCLNLLTVGFVRFGYICRDYLIFTCFENECRRKVEMVKGDGFYVG